MSKIRSYPKPNQEQVILDKNNEFDRRFGDLYLNGYFSESDYLTGRNYFNQLSGQEKETRLCHTKSKYISKIQRFLGNIKNAFPSLPMSCQSKH